MKKETDVKQNKITTIRWKYDDSSGQVADIYKKTIVKPRAMTKDKYKEYKESNCRAKKHSIKSGIYKKQSRIDLLDSCSSEIDELKEGFQSLTKLLEDYEITANAKEVMQLFSLILAGYTSELFLEFENSPTLFCSRAPVVLVERHKTDFTGGFEHLANIVRCLIVDTSSDGKLRHHNPAVLPDKFFSETIEECSYIKVKGDKSKRKFPAQYRNTAVLIHNDFFKKSDIENFVHRNPWASIFLFNKKNTEKHTASINLNMNLMNLSARNWDTIESIKACIRIHDLMKYFVYWLSEVYLREDISVRVRYWIRFGINAVQRYNYAHVKTRERIVQGSEKRFMWIQTASLRLFLDFCFEEGVIDENMQEELWNRWCNSLMPGSRDEEVYEQDQEKQRQEKENERNEVFEMYEKLLKQFIETASDDMFGHRKKYAKTYDTSVYYRDRPSILFGEYKPEEKKPFNCLIILKDDLTQFSNEKNSAFIEIIKTMWSKDYATVEYRPYIHTNNNFSIRRYLSPKAVVLDAEKLTFLKSAVHKKILKRIQEETQTKVCELVVLQ